MLHNTSEPSARASSNPYHTTSTVDTVFLLEARSNNYPMDLGLAANRLATRVTQLRVSNSKNKLDWVTRVTNRLPV